MVNKKFGEALVIERATKNGPGTGAFWKCLCECGKYFVASGTDLRRGATKTCGCSRLRNLRGRTHGKSNSRAYRIWSGMMTRCFNSGRASFKNYGGRGITVSPEWREFEGFYRDMGDPPAGHSIDRIDNDGNYGPKNCRWATRVQQNRNTSSNVWITIGAERRILSDWCRIRGLNISTVKTRVKSGQSWEQALGEVKK